MKKKYLQEIGFTLIEMLVVIAIIGILASLLMPGLRKALASARTIVCANNMRQMGAGSHMFADDHRGRFPGKIRSSVTSWKCFGWREILNETIFAGGSQIAFRFDSAYSSESLTCPSKEYVKANPYSNFFMASCTTTGGAVSNSGNIESVFGMLAPPSELPPSYQVKTGPNTYEYYWCYGTQKTKFKKPSSQFLFTETAQSGSLLQPRGLKGPGTIQLGTFANFPYYVGAVGGLEYYSFRHPNLTSNFIFIDGHCKPLNYLEDINSFARFNPSGEEAPWW